jgi:hypothetical protein
MFNMVVIGKVIKTNMFFSFLWHRIYPTSKLIITIIQFLDQVCPLFYIAKKDNVVFFYDFSSRRHSAIPVLL